MAMPIAARPITAAMSCLTKGCRPIEAGAAAPLAMLAEYTITRPPARRNSTTAKSTLSKASFLAIGVLELGSQLLETPPAVSVVVELVEARARGREQDDVATHRRASGRG